MARVLKRSRSTIFRELKRNFFSDESMPKHDGYYGDAAHRMTADRRARDRKLIKYPELCKRVIERLKNGWTPEQIGNRMIHEDAPVRVCQETIYRHIYSKEDLRDELWLYLPTHRIARRPRRARKKHTPKFHRDVSILFRPDDVAHRREFGHWEGDLMLFEQKLGQSNVTSLVERVSRFAVILKNPNKRTKPVMVKIIKAIKDLPHQARSSITFDRGSEFMNWPHLRAEIGTQTRFCDPSFLWQKGTVENTSRRARRWLSRKCLGWKTPAEVFREKVMEEMR
jgi:IS30 family transposase